MRISARPIDDGERCSIEISDTGEGVTAETKEKLFLPYFSTKARGTGLGLAIVARILEDHGGTVRVEENHPEGTRFLVELPVAANGEQPPAESAQTRAKA